MCDLLNSEYQQEPEYVLENDIIAGKTIAISNMDEGIESCKIYEVVEEVVQTTPEVVIVCSPFCDSGFTESINQKCNLDCFESVLALSPKKCHKNDFSQHASSMLGHDGFEEYVNEIYFHRLSIETKYHVPTCLDGQPEVPSGVRRDLIQRLTHMRHGFKLSPDTLYLAVSIVDRFLDVMQVSRDCLGLIGITSLLVASKQNEICPPQIHELLEKCEDMYTRDQVKQLETIILMATSFDLLAPTVQQFLEYFASFCLAMHAGDDEHQDRLKMARGISRYVLELSLQEYEFCQFLPSLVALCVWKASVELLKTHDSNFIPPGMTVEEMKYDLCMAEVKLFIDSFHQSCPELTAICDKYENLY